MPIDLTKDRAEAGTPDRLRPPIGEPPRSEPAEVRGAAVALAVMVAAGLFADIGLRGGFIGVGSAVLLSLTTVGLVLVFPTRSRETAALAAVTVAVAAFLSVRTSPWVVTLDWLAALGLLALTATSATGTPLVGQSLPGLARRATLPWLISPATAIAEPVQVMTVLHRRPREERGHAERRLPRQTGAVVRGLLMAAPVLVVLGLLLGSADAVFASFFDIPTPTFAFSLDGIVVHAFLFCVGAGAVAALIGAGRHVRPTEARDVRRLGAVEATVVMGALAALYTLFALAQVIAATGGDSRVQRTTGLTYAEYARSGFFQLLWAAGITLAVLLGIRATTRVGSPRQDLAVRCTSVVCCLLTLVVVGGAIQRLGVYRDAYGLTMLRLACTTFAWFLGATFLLLAARLLQGSSGRDWLPVALAGAALAALLWWNVSNPEALVARTNIDRAVADGKLDVGYADGMSDDAVPTLVAGLDRLPADLEADLRERLCTADDALERYDEPFDRGGSHVRPGPDGSVDLDRGWAAWNQGRRDAAAAVEACAR